MSADLITVPSLTVDEQATLNALLTQLHHKTPRNLLRSAYYDGKNAIRDIGIATPPALRTVAIVLGWSAKAVDVLNRRCHLDGFVIPGVDANDLGADVLWADNHLGTEAPQAGTSSLIHATTFLITTQGDEAAGEPPVLITAKDALSGTGIWDRRRHALSSFLSIIDTDDDGRPVDMVLYLPNLNISMSKDAGTWTVDRREHAWGVPVEPLVYRPRLSRPFGSSRISRAVMSLHQSALRTMVRSETTAEFYSVPQRVLLGADANAFRGPDGEPVPMWQALANLVWAVPADEDGNQPDIKQLAAATQQPHVDQLRAWAQLFAGETSIPISSLGISTDANPTSAEAYHASRDDLISEAEGTMDDWSPAWQRTALRALSMLNGWDEPPPQVRGLQPKWRAADMPSRAAAADAAAKTLDKFPWLAETEVGLELYGFDDNFIRRAMAEKRRQAGRGVLDALRSAAGQVAAPPQGPSEVTAATQTGD